MSHNLNQRFCMQDCHCQIALIEYQGQKKIYQNSWQQTFYQNMIGHRLGLNFFLFAQFLLNSHQAANPSQPQKSEKWEIKN